MSCTKGFVGLAVVLCFVGTVHAVTITEDFSTDPSTRGWVGVGNTDSPNDYGWSSSTNNAGGATGEAGGTFQARLGSGGVRGYWDSTIGGSLTQSESFSATGNLTVTDLNSSGTPYDGAFELGFINPTGSTAVSSTSGAHSGGYTPMVGFRINDNNPSTTEYRVNAQMAFGTDPGTERVQSGLLVLTAGTDYTFEITYDPDGGGAGMGVTTLDIRLLSDNSLVGSVSTPAISSTGTPVELNAFGFSGLTYAANTTTADIFIDNLEYTAAPEPNSVLLAGLGVVAAGCWHRRRRKVA